MKQLGRNLHFYRILCFIVATVVLAGDNTAIAIRFPNRISRVVPAEDATSADQVLKTAVFALGSFWRSESVFGCLHGVVRTTVGYAGGSKPNPEYRSLGDHAESVQEMELYSGQRMHVAYRCTWDMA